MTLLQAQHPLVPLPWHRTVFQSLHDLSPSWYPCHAKTNYITFCLAQYQLRCSPLGPIMHTMPTCQSAETLFSPTLLIPYPKRIYRRCRTFTSISGVHLPPPHALIATLAGQKPSHYPPSPQRLSLKLSSLDGSPDLVFPPPSLPIADDNLSLTSGTT